MAGHSVQPDIPPEGLTVLKVPEDDPSVDILFVHGFTGHPYLTWRHKHGTHESQDETQNDAEPPSKSRKLHFFSKPYENHVVYWPIDLLPTTIPGARIMTYGYNTNLRNKFFGPPPSRNSVYDIAWDMLVAVEATRRTAPDRPILFVAHSLGGIVVKEMLRRSYRCGRGNEHLRQVASSTIGVMFFGTPHSGTDPRGLLLHTLEILIRGLGWTLNKHVLDALLPSSERLRDLRDDFGPVAQEHGWVIHSFQEQFGVRFTAGAGGSKVVEDTSSYLGCPSIEVTQHIASNHMDMCRFPSLNDTEYRKVAAALDRMVERSGSSRKGPNSHGEEAPPALTPQRCRGLLESLEFDHMGDRQANIKRAHHKTCKWFFGHQAYKNWMDENKVPEHNGVLWIRGNPGTGKSTLLKYLLERTKSPAKRGVGDSKPKKIISFFFHARGNDLEKSTAGMYRHLIQQLLHKASDAKLLNIWSRLDDLGLTTAANPRWTIDRLKDLLQASILEMSCPIICFIDALDECDEYEIRDMLSYFSNLGQYVHEEGGLLQLCLSSRHYPHITIENSLPLTLEGQEGHSQDIVDYLKSELHIGNSKLAQTIRHEMLERASGIFMWVVLVVQILNKEFDDGNIHALRRKLNEIPSDLHELFQKILTRDKRNTDQLLLCIQWVLFSKRPLSPEELYFAILSRSDDNESLLSHAWEQEEITRDDIRKFIVSSSKGLAEVTLSKKPTAQFIHESVRDYLLRDEGLSKVWPGLGKDFSWTSHDVLKICCLNYINTMGAETGITDLESDVPKAPRRQTRVPKLFEILAKKFPFLEYALQNIFYHSDLAQSGGVCQIQFLKSFPRERWIRLDNGISRYRSREHTLAATLLYILAEKNAANLIRVLPERFTCVEYFNEPGTERYGPPLVAAIAHGSHEAIAQLLLSDAELSQHCNPSFIQEVSPSTEGQRNRRRQNLSLEWRPKNKAGARSMLYYLLYYAHPPYVAYFLELGCKHTSKSTGHLTSERRAVREAAPQHIHLRSVQTETTRPECLRLRAGEATAVNEARPKDGLEAVVRVRPQVAVVGIGSTACRNAS
ncbi:hypothetical protein DL770_008038 [Monosporascus sp. CRB-9-2]|nr:hypothetical protein DL770_008038 [Monosporascus sp. CRB-9-2]